MKRRAFTLVELLIVVSIISVLFLLTVRVTGALLTNAREGATQVTIRKVQRMLNERGEAFDRLTRRKGYIQTTTEYVNLGGISGGQQNLQKILAVKLLAKKYFPQRADEVLTANGTVDLTRAAWSNGDILYDFLTQSNTLGSLSVSADAFSSSEAKDTNGNEHLEFVDAWGNPLRFYRWPTRLFRPGKYWLAANSVRPIDATNAAVLISTLPAFTGNPQVDLGRDPDDPLRRCATAFDPFSTPAGDFEDAGFHTPATYHVMLVVSAGPDGTLGMYEPTDVANYGHLGAVSNPAALLDDITFLNVRAGGK